MTITQDSSAPLVAVVGATGAQGGSVVKALAESNKPYRVRGFTRDSTKPAAQKLVAQGVDVVDVSLVLDNVKNVFKAFEGANIAFLMTAFLVHLDAERETAEGKMMIDAAKAAGLERIVWSGLSNVTKISGGKYTHVVNFDSKALVTDYGRQSGVPFVDVQAGWYASNFMNPGQCPVKRPDGTFAIRLPVTPTASFPIIDAERDYGLYVVHVLEAAVFPDGEEVRTGEYLTMEEIALQLSQATGKQIEIDPMPMDQFEKEMTAMGLPPVLVLDLMDAYSAVGEFGYYGGKASPSVEGLFRTPTSWFEYAKTADWSKVLA
ncbi:NAD(P)-binding protein [Mycena olivaceomarginata]|nr:NAD(P)-binding protein [Mycena olivaceomarginata]